MPVNCDLCSYQGRNQSTTDHHIKAVHEKVKRYHCDLCDYGCYFKCNFRTHQKNKHGSTEEENPKTRKRKLFSKTNSKRKGKYECQRCSYTTQINQKLKDHINAVHEKVKRFNCDLCDFGTFYKHNLDRHINIKHSKSSDAENVIRLKNIEKSQILSCFVTFIANWMTFIRFLNYTFSKSLLLKWRNNLTVPLLTSYLRVYFIRRYVKLRSWSIL